ncbi:MAG: hypothetical protein ABI651_18420, partial [Verrucomicrobiota bacterium]
YQFHPWLKRWRVRHRPKTLVLLPPVAPRKRSADWQSAVSPVGNRRTNRQFHPFADCQSAIQQVAKSRGIKEILSRWCAVQHKSIVNMRDYSSLNFSLTDDNHAR